jgi:hypothetical protein
MPVIGYKESKDGDDDDGHHKAIIQENECIQQLSKEYLC